MVDARCMEVDVAFGKVVQPSSAPSIEKAAMVLKMAKTAKSLIN